MKNEVIIKNWLMAWLQPEVETEFNTSERVRQPLTTSNFDTFIAMFKDEKGDPAFTTDEIALLKGAITEEDPVFAFADGYPESAEAAIRLNKIYIIEAGWQQQNKYIGANFWEGKAATHIVTVGRSTGNSLNMAEPSLVLKMISSLLVAGQNYFTAYHLSGQVINEVLYGADEANSFDKGFAMRSLSITYDAHRDGVITQPRSHLDGQ